MDRSARLTGDNWQEWANQLLQRHYGPGEYQKVPDEDKGDAGIEGFTRTTGCAYQIYGPEGVLTPDEQYRKLRKKISTDIKKFIDNGNAIIQLLGPIKIRRWILLVPAFRSKEIVKYVAKKTQDVIAAGLPYVDSNFYICVEDEDAFAVEREYLLNSGLDRIWIMPDEVTQDTINAWTGQNDSFVQRLDEKISRLPTLRDQNKRQEFRNRIIKHFLEGQTALDELRQYPLAAEAIRKAKSQRERYLATETMIETGSNSDILMRCLNQILETVKREVRGVSDATAETVAWEAVSDWLIRCPLDFP